MARSKRYVPDRGDIIWADFTPAAGHEQLKTRPALVLSPLAFNTTLGLALVAPITSTVRGHGFETALSGGKTEGVVLCHQVRTIDYRARNGRFIEKAAGAVLKEALAKVRTLVQ